MHKSLILQANLGKTGSIGICFLKMSVFITLASILYLVNFIHMFLSTSAGVATSFIFSVTSVF